MSWEFIKNLPQPAVEPGTIRIKETPPAHPALQEIFEKLGSAIKAKAIYKPKPGDEGKKP